MRSFVVLSCLFLVSVDIDPTGVQLSAEFVHLEPTFEDFEPWIDARDSFELVAREEQVYLDDVETEGAPSFDSGLTVCPAAAWEREWAAVALRKV